MAFYCLIVYEMGFWWAGLHMGYGPQFQNMLRVLDWMIRARDSRYCKNVCPCYLFSESIPVFKNCSVLQF